MISFIKFFNTCDFDYNLDGKIKFSVLYNRFNLLVKVFIIYNLIFV